MVDIATTAVKDGNLKLENVPVRLYDEDGNYIGDLGTARTITSDELEQAVPENKYIMVNLRDEGEVVITISDKAQIEGVYDILKKMIEEAVKPALATFDNLYKLFKETEFVEPPKPQNSVKRWKREKKYF